MQVTFMITVNKRKMNNLNENWISSSFGKYYHSVKWINQGNFISLQARKRLKMAFIGLIKFPINKNLDNPEAFYSINDK